MIRERWLMGVCALSAACFTILGSANDAGAQELGTHQMHYRVDLGVRASYISNEGYDPFAEDDLLAAVSLGGSRTLFAADRLSLAAAVYFDYGARTGKARGAQTSLDVYRLTLGPELRYHVLPFAFAFVRVVPGAMYRDASLDDTLVGKLESDAWAFALDASVGAAVEIYGMQNPASRKARFWGIGEFGYGYGTTSELSFEPSDPQSSPQRTQPIAMGELAVRGLMFRIAAAVSF